MRVVANKSNRLAGLSQSRPPAANKSLSRLGLRRANLGQLAFVAAVLLAMTALAALPIRWPNWGAAVPAYGIGSFAIYWFCERIASIVVT